MNRLNAMTFKQLRALNAVAETGTISMAAELLSLTPPAVHSQLKALEENFGCNLLIRGSEGFAPTPEGQALLSAYRTTRAALERAVHHIEALHKGYKGTVVLAVVSTAKYFAPQLVADLRRALPDIDVVLKIGNRARVIQYLENSDLDLAIMGRPPRLPPLEANSIGDHPHILIAPPDHPLTARDHVRGEEILKEHFIMREEGSGTRILAMRYLDDIGMGREVSHTVMESNETIKQAVRAGLGIALISAHTACDDLRSGRLKPIRVERMPILRSWFVLHRADADLSPAASAVRAWIVDNAAQFLPNYTDPADRPD